MIHNVCHHNCIRSSIRSSGSTIELPRMYVTARSTKNRAHTRRRDLDISESLRPALGQNKARENRVWSTITTHGTIDTSGPKKREGETSTRPLCSDVAFSSACLFLAKSVTLMNTAALEDIAGKRARVPTCHQGTARPRQPRPCDDERKFKHGPSAHTDPSLSAQPPLSEREQVSRPCRLSCDT